MLTISNKGKLMPESPIRKLVPFAEKAKQKGVKVFHLNIGQPDIETPPAAIEAVKNSKIKVLAYSKSEGNIELRNKICNYYSKLDIKINNSKHKQPAREPEWYIETLICIRTYSLFSIDGKQMLISIF